MADIATTEVQTVWRCSTCNRLLADVLSLDILAGTRETVGPSCVGMQIDTYGRVVHERTQMVPYLARFVD